MRRPQRPGNQSHAEAPSGGTLPAIHPRESPGTASSAAMLWQGLQNISLECRQLCALHPPLIKQKSMLDCAETVDAVDSLWKFVENQDGGIQTHRLGCRTSTGFLFHAADLG